MSTYLLAIIYLIPALATICMTVVILCRNYRNALYRATGGMFAVSSMNFMAMYFMNSAPLEHRGYILKYVLFPLITMLVISVLHFWFRYTKAYERRGSLFYKLLLIPYYAQLLLIPIKGYSTHTVGLRPDGSIYYTPGPGIYLFWGLSGLAVGIIIRLFIPLLRKEPGPAKVLLAALILSTGFGVMINTASILFHSQRYLLDKLTTHSILFALVAVFINMIKYNDLPSFEKRYRIMFEHAPLGILIADQNGAIREANPLALQILKRSTVPSELMEVLAPKKREAWLHHYRDMFKGKKRMQHVELTLTESVGVDSTVSLDSEFMVVGAESLQFFMIQDITEMKRKEQQITYLAYHDGLTGLFNRAAFQRELEQRLHASAGFTMILMDINKFKMINDTYGHHAGDLALRHVADRLTQAACPSDFVARFAGDELVVLTMSQAHADRLLERAKDMLARDPLRLEGGKELPIAFSFGTSSFPEDGAHADDLYKKADERMYRMKFS